MKALNIQIAIKIYEYEELSAADRELIDAACQATPVPRPSRRDSCHSRPQRVRRISGRAYSAMRGLPAGDARNGKTLQTPHACTAVRENRHL